MNFQRWLNQRRPDWQRLEGILSRGQPLPPEDLRVLGGLYRQVSADLAKAQYHQLGQDLLGYLQGLTLQAHNQVYQPPVATGGFGRALQALPGQVRAVGPIFTLSLGIFLGGMLVGAILYGFDASFIETLLPPSAVAGVREKGQLWMSGSTLALAPLDSSLLMTNNISVALGTFAGGMLAGAGTVFILFFNGVLLGAAAIFVADYGLSFPFWAFVSAHGVPELTAIFLAGTAGLLLGRAILDPWPYTRWDRLVMEGRRAVPILIVVVGLLVWAGLLEGFISPNDGIPAAIKFAIGLVELGLMGGFLLLGRR